MSPYNLAVILIDIRVKPIYYLKTEHFYDVNRDGWCWADNDYEKLRRPDDHPSIYHPEQFRNLVIERKTYE